MIPLNSARVNIPICSYQCIRQLLMLFRGLLASLSPMTRKHIHRSRTPLLYIAFSNYSVVKAAKDYKELSDEHAFCFRNHNRLNVHFWTIARQAYINPYGFPLITLHKI